MSVMSDLTCLLAFGNHIFPDDTYSDAKPQLGMTLLEENRLVR